MEDLPQGAEAIVAARNERGVLLQLGGCCGCLGFVGLILSLLVWTMLKADRETQITPREAEASLQAVVPCQLPPGYRGFRGISRGGRRIVLATPHTHSGLKVPLDGRLTLSVWTFQGADTPAERLAEVQAYFESKLQEEFSGELAPPLTAPLELRLRGRALAAQALTYTCGPAPGVEVRLLLALFPRQAGSEELVAIGAIGAAERFDRAALDAFLGSIK